MTNSEAAIGSLASRAYARLRDDILSGRYSSNDLLSEQALAERLGMSRTPVRRALAELDQK